MKKQTKQSALGFVFFFLNSLMGGSPAQSMVPDTEKATNRHAINTLTIRNSHELKNVL